MSGNATHTLGIDFTVVETTPQFTLGEIKPDRNGNEYQYVKVTVAVTQYFLVIIPSTHIVGANGATTTLVDAVNPCRLGIVQHANFTDSGQYGWVLISGNGSVYGLTSCAGDVPVYTTATAGNIDDTSTTLVVGLKLTAAVGGGGAAVATCHAATRLYAA